MLGAQPLVKYKEVSFFCLKLIKGNGGQNWLYFSGKLYRCLGLILGYFPDLLCTILIKSKCLQNEI